MYLDAILLPGPSHIDGHPHVDKRATHGREEHIAVTLRQHLEKFGLYYHGSVKSDAKVNRSNKYCQ